MQRARHRHGVHRPSPLPPLVREAGEWGSGLVDALHILKGIDGIAQVYLTEKDVVRHRLVQQIVKAYERAAQPPKRAPQAKPETANA